MMDKKEELRKIAGELLPDPLITMAYVEHQMDLMGQLILDVIESTGVELSPEAEARVEMLQELMKHSSVNFERIQDQLQSYKLPKAIEYKERTRTVQDRYLKAQIKEGVF